jgi:hypothetical protein
MSELINNLNFDVEEHFGLGVGAFSIKIKNVNPFSPNPTSKLPALIFDASGIVYEAAGRDRNFTSLDNDTLNLFEVETTAGSPGALALSTRSYPILIEGVIYEVLETNSTIDSLRQFNDAQFNVLKGSIDGTLKQGEEIQPNYVKRNFYYQQDNFVVMKGQVEIDQNTGVVIDVFKDTQIELTFLVKGFG